MMNPGQITFKRCTHHYHSEKIPMESNFTLLIGHCNQPENELTQPREQGTIKQGLDPVKHLILCLILSTWAVPLSYIYVQIKFGLALKITKIISRQLSIYCIQYFVLLTSCPWQHSYFSNYPKLFNVILAYFCH